MLSLTRKNGLSRGVKCVLRRNYHDESFGFRKPRQQLIPDYTPSQLENRATNAALLRYVDLVRQHGHRAAAIDPLDILERDDVAALTPERYGLVDRSKSYSVNGILSPSEQRDDSWTLDEVVKMLQEVYVGRVAYEYMHCPNKGERLWFSHHLESSAPKAVTTDDAKRRIWELLARSETFDHFLQLKFPNLKRYGLEGAESMLPALDSLFSSASQAGIENIVLCLPHRGRLSLLTDLLQYPPAALFNKIKGYPEFPEDIDGVTGDVISHLVSNPSLQYEGAAKPVKISMLQNPSHLEAINSVALGKTRAKQYSLLKGLGADAECMLGDKVMCVQLHGDAAFTGQGVVMEGLGLSNLPHYTSGGSIHIVVNNNIGYTTPASSARSSLYCSDIGKMINAPILHVNGDYPEDVARAMKTAFAYRNFFRKDIIIDLITYRRWGHNELDEPAFTQPLMYQKIRNRQSVPKLYEDSLIAAGTLTSETAASARASYKSHLEEQLKEADAYKPRADMLENQWKNLVWPYSKEAQKAPETGVDVEVLKSVGRTSVKVPADFEIHPTLQRHVKRRVASLESGTGIDWGTAEALAWGSLMAEGYDVRISGQDVGRGTFSHRHAMLVDQRTEGVHVPLNSLESNAKLELANSSLSEMAVLGFEYGMSWENPNLLPIWEAQFGDFFNGSQVIIDTFISSAEAKWLKQSGLVMLLPHGLDGAGPEHSSARIERMLQLTNDPFEPVEGQANVNMHVVNPTTPAQYFHLLRRQMKRNYRRPLIVAAPKALLRAPAAASKLAELSDGTRFSPVLAPAQPSSAGPQPTRINLVSGKIYYELTKELQSRNLTADIELIRIEELCPFPFSELETVLAPRLRQAKEAGTNLDICWVQEEAKNQGAFPHVGPRIQTLLDRMGSGKKLRYEGRKESAVPAVGVGKWHAAEHAALLELAMRVPQ